MKLHRLKAVASVIALTVAAFPTLEAATIVGTGADVSYLVIEASEFGAPLQYEYHYTFNIASPIDTYAMLSAVDLADSNLSIDFINFGSPEAPNYFLNSITFNSITLDSTDPFWAQWVSGGKSGFPTGTDIANGTWSEGYGLSLPYRELAPGSWDGFTHNGTYNPEPPFNLTSAPPSVAPVPEPATFVLLALAGLLLGWRARRRHA